MCLENGLGLLSRREAGPDRISIVSTADHHLHIQSVAATTEMRSVADRLPELFSRLSPALLAPRGGDEVLDRLDDAGIAQGVLLSEGYIFSSPFATPGIEAEAPELTRRENRFNVDAALASNGRLRAFVGINPLSAHASAELAYWAGRDGATGVKLHLGNSGLDPRSEADVARLADFVGEVRATGLALLIHARHAGPYDPADTDRFIDRVLSQAEGIVVQIAHGGAGGGVADAAEAIGHYADAIERGAPGLDHLLVDLSCVLALDPGSEESARHLANFVEGARRIGIGRIVMGSDWPTLCSPREHDALIAAQLPFTPAEWHSIAANRASYLD